MQEPLTIPALKSAATSFAAELSSAAVPELYGVNDGKTVGTYVEAAFNSYITRHYRHAPGNAASGIDFPELGVDLKVTSVKKPQSSCPFRNAVQKVYGLDYHLLVVVYEKFDDESARTGRLEIRHVIFVESGRTADYQVTRGIRAIVNNQESWSRAVVDDIDAYLEDRNLPLDPESRRQLATRIASEPPAEGFLTISNAQQWRLQYGHAIKAAQLGGQPGVEDLLA